MWRVVFAFIGQIIHPVIRDQRELRLYVLKTCLICVAVALAVDVVNQLVFFVSFAEALRSWAITIALAAAISLTVSGAIGRAHLELFRSKEDFEQLSRLDPLTGLLNRRALLEVAAAMEPVLMALVIVDIDRFKRINDTYGHLVGDHVIREVSHLLQTELGDLGYLGRIGGEEFALLARGADFGLLRLKLEQVRTKIALATVSTREGALVRATVSIGTALASAGEDITELYARADRALYAAKTAGRNRIAYAGDLGVNVAPFPAEGERGSIISVA